MAVPLHLTSVASCLQSKIGVSSSPQASFNCSTMLKTQSTSLFSSSTPNITVDFYQKVNKSLPIRSRNKRAGGRVSLMPIGTPMMLVENGDSWQFVDLWNAFYRDRIMFLGQEIDEEYSNLMLATLLYLDTLDSDESILLFINCPGGSLTPCLALYDTIKSLRSEVGSYNMSYAGDMAGFILASAAKGKRVGMPLSQVVLRSPAAAARGRADDVLIEAHELLRIKDYLYNELAKNTGQPVEKVHKDLSAAKHFRVAEAIQYGIIDRVVRPPKLPDVPPKRDEDEATIPKIRGYGRGIGFE